MTKKAAISVAELKRFAEVASLEGVTIEVVREGTLIRVMPFHANQAITQQATREDEAEVALRRWMADQDTATPPKPSLRKLREEEPDEWDRERVKRPLGKREMTILLELDRDGIDGRMEPDYLSAFGHQTSRRLLLRGLIDFSLRDGSSMFIHEVWLTDAGKAAVNQLKARERAKLQKK